MCWCGEVSLGGILIILSTNHMRAGACERAGDITRVDATCHMDAARRGTHTGDPHRGPTQRGPTPGTHRGPAQGTHTGDPHRGEGPTEDPRPEGRATQGTHIEPTQTIWLINHLLRAHLHPTSDTRRSLFTKTAVDTTTTTTIFTAPTITNTSNKHSCGTVFPVSVVVEAAGGCVPLRAVLALS